MSDWCWRTTRSWPKPFGARRTARTSAAESQPAGIDEPADRHPPAASPHVGQGVEQLEERPSLPDETVLVGGGRGAAEHRLTTVRRKGEGLRDGRLDGRRLVGGPQTV